MDGALGQVKHWDEEWANQEEKFKNLKTEDQLGKVPLNQTSLCKSLKGNN